MIPVTIFVWTDSKMLVRVFEMDYPNMYERDEAVARHVEQMKREIGATSEDHMENWQAVYDSRLIVEVRP